MKKIKEIDILNNKKLVIILNILALVLFFPFAALFAGLAFTFPTGERVEIILNPLDFLAFLLLFFLLLIVHELIHGLFFKVFKPESKVTFGFNWKSMMAYATSPGSLYKRGQMLVISLSPFVFISIFLTIAALLGWIPLLVYVFLASLHAAGCIGDFYYAYLLLCKYWDCSVLVEDTDKGITIYSV